MLIGWAGYSLGCRKAEALESQQQLRMACRSSHYGMYLALWMAVPVMLLMLTWQVVDQWWMVQSILTVIPAAIHDSYGSVVPLLVQRVVETGSLPGQEPWHDAVFTHYQLMEQTSGKLLAATSAMLAASMGWLMYGRIVPEMNARVRLEQGLLWLMRLASAVAILITVAIVLAVLFESIRFFGFVSPFEFLFGTEWSPQAALRADQGGASGSYGALPLFAGTLLITVIAMLVAVPLGLLSAIYMSEYATPRLRGIAKPVLEVLAGVPTVVYGYFAAIIIAPVIRDIGQSLGLSASSESALAAGLVMGIMIIPFISSLSDDVINAVPQSLRDAALGLGATHSETVVGVVLPAATPGIMGAVLLAVSRAIGETMIVVMAAGLAANLTLNPLDSVTTVTAQIVALLVGDQEFDSPKTLAAFALGLTLFVMTLLLNIIALRIVKNYRNKYA